jgi:hypothetical protein
MFAICSIYEIEERSNNDRRTIEERLKKCWERYIKKVMLLYSGSKNPKVKLARIPLNSDFKK